MSYGTDRGNKDPNMRNTEASSFKKYLPLGLCMVNCRVIESRQLFYNNKVHTSLRKYVVKIGTLFYL